MAAAQDQISYLGRTTAQERVATFLLNIARRSGAEMVAPVEIDVPFGRLDIADYLGLTVETVSREISNLSAMA
jgi:CRP-like cAMP-binding protein